MLGGCVECGEEGGGSSRASRKRDAGCFRCDARARTKGKERMSRQPHATARRNSPTATFSGRPPEAREGSVVVMVVENSPVCNVVSVAERQGVLSVELALEPACVREGVFCVSTEQSAYHERNREMGPSPLVRRGFAWKVLASQMSMSLCVCRCGGTSRKRRCIPSELPRGAVTNNLRDKARHRRLSKVVVLDAKTQLANGGHLRTREE